MEPPKPPQPDIHTIQISLEKAIRQGSITPPLMQLTLQEVCEKPGKIADMQIQRTLEIYTYGVKEEIEYILHKADEIIRRQHQTKVVQPPTKVALKDFIENQPLAQTRVRLGGCYERMGMSEGEATLKKRFATLDRMARDFVEHDLGIKVKGGVV